jgi:phosphopantothenoylcysteine synthetase/decarboxylase
MSRSKIVLQITGSIAAYKAAYLASALVQKDYEVQVLLTEAAEKFVGKATFEGLTGRVAISDMWERGRNMEHIDLAKWADLFLLAPATANTINRLATGMADDLIGSLFLANNFNKPYWIAPAMNTGMFQHPATQSSMKQLRDWGAFIFETDVGRLACGDTGEGKFIEPDRIVEKVVAEFSENIR